MYRKETIKLLVMITMTTRMDNKPRRWTKQKKTIIDVVYESEIHLTADEIYFEARKVLPKISLGTVYRDLMMLRDLG